MPEGPEVRRSADLVHSTLAGQPILELRARTKDAKAWLHDHPAAFPGRRVERVIAHGKHLIGYVEGELYFHSHFMMWGKWIVVPSDDEMARVPDRRERARIAVAARTAILLSAPVFEVGRGDPYADDERLAGLGPDILPYDGDFDEATFLDRLLAPDQRTRTIGAALLDQSVCAGIGNYLRAEILYLCQIDPWRRNEDLTAGELGLLCRTIPDTAKRAYLHRRTVSETVQQQLATDPDLVYQPGREYGTRHYVFRRTNLPCLRCDDVIRQLRQVTRKIGDEEKTRIMYFCPTCQGTTVDVKPPKPRPQHA